VSDTLAYNNKALLKSVPDNKTITKHRQVRGQ